MIRAQLAVESRVLRLDEMIVVLGRDPDAGHEIGSRSPLRPDHVREWAAWELDLVPDESLHAGTEGLSGAIERLGSDLADCMAQLSLRGCVVVISIVQELDVADSSTKGLHFTAEALAWMARAHAVLDVDQYVLDGSEAE